MLEKIREFINEANASNSTKDKMKVIEKYPELKELFIQVYSPFIKFYVTSDNIKKYGETYTFIRPSSYNDIMDLLYGLSHRDITGNTALDEVWSFIIENEEYKDEILRVIDKNLKTRTDAKLINKVFPKLVPTFNVALANKYDGLEDKVDFEKDTWLASHKLDGCLKYDTLLEFEDGITRAIGDVVNERITGKVKCFNIENNTVEFQSITGWMINNDISGSENWYRIKLSNGVEITITGNHLVYIPEISEWVRTDELVGGMEVLYGSM